MAHFLPPRGAATGSGAPALDLAAWLHGWVAATVLPQMGDDATAALDAVLQDPAALAPSQTFAAAAALEHQARQRAHRRAAAAAAAAASNRAGSSLLPPPPLRQLLAPPLAEPLPPPVTCVEAAEEVLGSLFAQVGVLPLHRSLVVDLCEEAAVGLLVALKEEGLRLSGSAEAAERLSGGGPALEAAMRRDPAHAALAQFYARAVTLSPHASAPAGSGGFGARVEPPAPSEAAAAAAAALEGAPFASAGLVCARADTSRRGSAGPPPSFEWEAPAFRDLWWPEERPADSSSSSRAGALPAAGALAAGSLLTDRRSVAALFSVAHSAAWLSRRLELHAELLLRPPPSAHGGAEATHGTALIDRGSHSGSHSGSSVGSALGVDPTTATVDDARTRQRKGTSSAARSGGSGSGGSSGAGLRAFGVPLTASCSEYRRLQVLVPFFHLFTFRTFLYSWPPCPLSAFLLFFFNTPTLAVAAHF
jgi:hypothetical protein